MTRQRKRLPHEVHMAYNGERAGELARHLHPAMYRRIIGVPKDHIVVIKKTS